MRPDDRLPAGLLLLSLVALAVSAVKPHDYPTWMLEVAPALIAWAILGATRRRFPMTPLVYVLVFVHGLILMLGGHYTYAEVPLGDWVSEALGWERNHYDRLGHLAQGFVPAIVAREVFIRTSPVHRGRWLAFFVVSTCLAMSAFYEFIEWWVALIAGGGAVAFLGTQGDPWDTQWDMFLCLLGAIASLALLSRLHDRQLRELGPENAGAGAIPGS